MVLTHYLYTHHLPRKMNHADSFVLAETFRASRLIILILPVVSEGGNESSMISVNAETDMMCCASCGIAEVDDIKLKRCTCKLVRYCSAKCQREHRSHHKRECKKRLAELRDEILFKQPESSHLGDCPICCLPLPLSTVARAMPCCSKLICNGCTHANMLREREDMLEHSCPFCRHAVIHAVSMSDEKVKVDIMKRIEANDPVAMSMCQMSLILYAEENYSVALKYLTKAAELGNMEAHYNLACRYDDGKGVEKDKKKEIFHLEQAAIGGHHLARYMLGCEEFFNGKIERAKKHWIIAANLGLDDSIEALKQGYAVGHVSKEEFAAALRAHQAAVDATKSSQREAADAAVAAEEAIFL
jgi:hypothetical protein